MNPDSPMKPDKYQQAWQKHSSETRVTVDAGLLLKEVQRNQRDFRAMIFRRDVIEVAVGLLMLPYWFYAGITKSLPWTWWLTVPAIVWCVGFFLVDRMRHPQTPSDPGEPLLNCVKNSLTQVEHQIWLLRNVFWWYLLPFTISILAFFAQVSLQSSKNWLEALGVGGFLLVFLVALYSFIDYINQRAVRLQLEPRRQELVVLLASLGADDSSENYASARGVETFESSSVLRRWLIVAVLCFAIYVVMALALASGFFDARYDGPPRSSGPAGDSLAKLVTDLRKEKNLVGLAAMVTVDGQIEAAAADGERKKVSGVPVEIGDQWHLGGITRSITVTMIARLVESGKMQWSDTVGEVFPEASVHEDWERVTLMQLLTNTAGAPPNFPIEVRLLRPALGPECTRARREAVLNVIADKPACPPGEKYVSSNVGYTIAGAMAEKATGATWEDLVKREVFEPLKLTSAGFGPPKSSNESLEQPRGHRMVLAGKVAVDDEADNTSIMGPSGSIHMTLRDLCTYATDHLRGELGEGKLLTTETYMLLHTPVLDDFACGWVKNEPNNAIPYTEYWHDGSNTMWYALVAFIPETKMVVAVTSNDGDFVKAEQAACEILKASVKQIKVGIDPSGQVQQKRDAPRRSQR